MTKLFCLLSCFFLFHISCLAQYNIEDPPNPKQRGSNYYVSNPDGILSDYTVASLDSLAKQVDQQSSAEIAVVVISDFYVHE